MPDLPKNKSRAGAWHFKNMYREGVINPYYQYRIDAAVELFMSGKIEFILVSGANTSIYYNEPEMMKKDLIAAWHTG